MNRLIISYLTLRKLIGALGFLLPIVLAVGGLIYGGCTGIQESISAYYYTGVRDIFVGVIFVMAFFLFSYKGYDWDNIVANVGGAFALGVALFPANAPSKAVRAIHFISAGLLFAVYAFFSLYLFRMGAEKGQQSPRKRTRNKVYLICGILIVVFIACIPVSMAVVPEQLREDLSITFWLETLALWAFAVSWNVKGQLILRDPKGE